MADGKIALQKDSDAAIQPVTEAGTKKDKEEYALLSEIIKLLNDRFGTDFTEADRLFFDQIEEEIVMDEKLGMQARNNSMENFKYGFDDVFMDKLVERMDQNQDIFNKITDDKAFASVVKDYLLKKVYERLKQSEEDKPLFFNDVISVGSLEEGYLPVYDLQAVATSFREQKTPGIKGWKPM